MKNKIRAKPFIGARDTDGTFKYNEGRITIRYAVITDKTLDKKNIPHWLSIKIRTSSYANNLRRLRTEFADFWAYRKWLIFLHPFSLATLVVIAVIVYAGAVELQPGKGYLTRWFVSYATGISVGNIEYEGAGWIRIYGTRTAAVNKEIEPFSYNVNVFGWLILNDAGSITRRRDAEYGPVTHQLGYENGEVYLNKEKTWRKGTVENGIKWEKPQGSGIRAGQIKGEILEPGGGQIRLRDK